MNVGRIKDKIFLMPVCLLLSLVLLGTACQKQKNAKSVESKTTAKYPMSVTDDSGHKVKMASKPKRIISLAPSNTEILFSLGLADKIVGVTSYCDYPPEAKKKEEIGSFAGPNIEKILAQKPDLVVATGDLQEPVAQELEKLKVTVFVCNPKNLDGLLNNIRKIGAITGAETEAKKLTDSMTAVEEKVSKKVAKLKESEKPKVFFELYNEPLTTVGKDTFHNELIEIAGGKNIAGNLKESYPQFSVDTLINESPDVFISIKDTMYDPGDIAARPGYADIKAIRDNRVTVINGDLVNRPGPRITEGLWQIAKAIHPELFK
jgi:iron complex transport system substrate-binding protein